MRTADRRDAALPSRPGGQAVTSAVVLALILTPALVVVAGAAARQLSSAAREGARAVGPPGPPASHDKSARSAGYVAAVSGMPDGRAVARAAAAPDQAANPAVQLLEAAADAGRVLSYTGVQIVTWWDPNGTSTTVVDIAHQPRQGTVLQIVRTGAAPAVSFVAAQASALPGDVLGITEQTLDLLAANYDVAVAGRGSACDRPAEIVEARRGDGTLAARFWLDLATKIPLRRELFDRQARMVNESTFIDVTFEPSFSAGPGQAVGVTAARPWDPLTLADLGKLRAADWPLPAQLPGGLTLFDARRHVMPVGQVIELGYSDGLSSVSLFVQPGDLPRQLAGFHKMVVGGWPVFARDPLGHRLTWASNDHVLTMIADAPEETIGAAVDALPHDTSPGFWARMGHGFSRLVSWLNPFR